VFSRERVGRAAGRVVAAVRAAWFASAGRRPERARLGDQPPGRGELKASNSEIDEVDRSGAGDHIGEDAAWPRHRALRLPVPVVQANQSRDTPRATRPSSDTADALLALRSSVKARCRSWLAWPRKARQSPSLNEVC
jgi:hypothetical protein